MIVIISHPTEELKLIRLQKKLIESINDDNTIWFRNVPLWIEVPHVSPQQDLKELSKQIETITLNSPELSGDGNCIFLPVQIKTKKEVLNSELPLIYRLKGNTTTAFPADLADLDFSQMQLKQCQLAVVSKLHDAGAAVQSCKTSSYILQNSVWFKQAK